jgi:uncharacterized RDD family membrane protein YckC
MSADNRTTAAQVDMGTNWLLRFVAALIDSIPWVVIGLVLWWVLAQALTLWLVYTFLIPILYGLFYVIYGTIMESSAMAATLGKRVMGLKVQMLSGGKAPLNKVLTRNISKIFWIIFLIDILLGIATHGPDPRQRYFDRIAGTTVVSVKQAIANVPPPPPPS